MSEENAPSWTTFWNRQDRRVLILAGSGGFGTWAGVERDEVSSMPGAYDIWRASSVVPGHPLKDRGATEPICCVEIHLDEHDRPIGFPDHLLSRDVLGSMTIWPYPEYNSFIWWSPGDAGRPTSYDALSARTNAFDAELESFKGFTTMEFRVGDLLDNTAWEWGYGHGVYCFVREGEVAYVGRALGATLGQRIWDQLQSQDDEAWKQVVTDRETRVRVFVVEDDFAYMASALEAFLIDRMKPTFNSRKQ